MVVSQLKIHDSHLGCISAYSGAIINFLEPELSDIRIEDIAHGLSNICRFGGHISQFYSVAQHSVLVSALAPKYLKKAALLHDAQETYLGDVVTPLKHILGDKYKDLENQFQMIIAKQFGLDPAQFVEIKTFDKLALEIEARALKDNNHTSLFNVMKNYSDGDYIWTPEDSRALYTRELYRAGIIES